MKEILAHKWSFPFANPVDDVKLNLPVDFCLKVTYSQDYYSVITTPMDLGSIKKRLKNGYYENCASCIADFDQVFQNCFTYNSPQDVDSSLHALIPQDVYKMGKALEEIFRDRLQALPTPEFV